MHEYVFGLAIANDVSARDVQIPQMQFFKAKSDRGFCPPGGVSRGARPGGVRVPRPAHLDIRGLNGEVRQHVPMSPSAPTGIDSPTRPVITAAKTAK